MPSPIEDVSAASGIPMAILPCIAGNPDWVDKKKKKKIWILGGCLDFFLENRVQNKDFCQTNLEIQGSILPNKVGKFNLLYGVGLFFFLSGNKKISKIPSKSEEIMIVCNETKMCSFFCCCL